MRLGSIHKKGSVRKTLPWVSVVLRFVPPPERKWADYVQPEKASVVLTAQTPTETSDRFVPDNRVGGPQIR